MTRVSGKKPVSHAVMQMRSGVIWVTRCRCGWGTWFWSEAAASRAVSEHLAVVV